MIQASTIQAGEMKAPAALRIFDFSPTAEWSLGKRIAFRLVAAYFILFNLPYQGHVSILGPIPGSQFLTQPYIRGSRRVVEWVAAHVFHLTGSIAVYPRVNGSGDSTLDYIHQLLMVVIALVATIVSSILDRKRPNYRRFHAWLRIWVRYALLLTLFGYGFAKVFPLQFPPPYLARLLEPLNEFSPMGVLWTFMGVSPAYTIFSGAAEVTGGLLLMFRRTTTIGALVSAAVMLNVVMLNFSYDVPVKLYSTNLLLMAIFLAAPDLKRLFDAFVMNRAIQSSKVDTPLFRSRGARIATVALKTVFLGYVLFLQIRGGIQGYRNFYSNAPRSPLYGIWNVESFVRSGQEVTGGSRWSKVVMDRPQSMAIRREDQPMLNFQTSYDQAQHRITLTKSGYLDYTRSDESSLIFDGVVLSEPVKIRLKKIDTSKYLLLSRGFHWINELPFNR
jgi:hypothetical protein